MTELTPIKPPGCTCGDFIIWGCPAPEHSTLLSEVDRDLIQRYTADLGSGTLHLTRNPLSGSRPSGHYEGS